MENNVETVFMNLIKSEIKEEPISLEDLDLVPNLKKIKEEPISHEDLDLVPALKKIKEEPISHEDLNLVPALKKIKEEPISHEDLDLVPALKKELPQTCDLSRVKAPIDDSEEELPLPSQVVIKEEPLSEDETGVTDSPSLPDPWEDTTKVNERPPAIQCPFCNKFLDLLHFTKHLPQCEEWSRQNFRKETHHATDHKVHEAKKKGTREPSPPPPSSAAKTPRAFAGFSFHHRTRRSPSLPFASLDGESSAIRSAIADFLCPLSEEARSVLFRTRKLSTYRKRQTHPSLNEGELPAERRKRGDPTHRSTRPEEDQAAYCLTIDSLETEEETTKGGKRVKGAKTGPKPKKRGRPPCVGCQHTEPTAGDQTPTVKKPIRTYAGPTVNVGTSALPPTGTNSETPAQAAGTVPERSRQVRVIQVPFVKYSSPKRIIYYSRPRGDSSAAERRGAGEQK